MTFFDLLAGVQNTFHVKYPYPVKQIELDQGTKLAYCDVGKGEQTLIFIHGLGNYIPVWQKNIDVLQADFRCIAIDLPGNGLSEGGDFDYSMKFYAESVSQFIKKMQLENVVLCGHSMGGQVALTLCLNEPSLFEKLVLFAPSGLESFSAHEKMMLSNMLSLGEMMSSNEFQIEQAIKSSFFHFPNNEGNKIISELKDLIRNSNNKGYSSMIRKSIQAMLNENPSAGINAIMTKTLIIFGSDDALIPNKIIHPMTSVKGVLNFGTSQMTNSKGILVENAGHFVQFEKAEVCNAALKDFILK
jgi:pimeloyl-ACP methyl ester carboxylesterase